MTLYKRSETVRDFNGVVVSKVSVRVVEGSPYSDTAPLATLFQDAAGLVPQVNPMTADAAGQYSYWAAGGTYSEKISRPGYFSTTNDAFLVGGAKGDPGPQGNAGPQGGVGPQGDPGPDIRPLLSDTILAANGAGMMGFNYTLAYAAGTIGKWLKDLAGATGATFLGYLAPFTGSKNRTAYDKFAEMVYASDFLGGTELAQVQAGIAAQKAVGGTLVIPATFSASIPIPDPALSAGQSITIIDLRSKKNAKGFGAETVYVEARDSGGGYASERRVVGKQNPAFVAETVSDGNATGYAKRNKASSFVHLGPRDRSITAASNASPIVITTSTPHQLGSGGGWRVDIAGVLGNTAANGSWTATQINATQFSLDNSVGNGAYTSGGTASVYGSNLWQLFNDPLFKGYDDYCIYQYSNGGSGAVAVRIGVDSSSLTRFDLTPYRLESPWLAITGATNTTPIEITTAVNHGIGSTATVTISGVLGNTAANGTFTATQTAVNKFTLGGSVGNGAYASGGRVVITPAITNATNATPIVITTATPHGINGNNAQVTVAGVGGNTAANGDWLVTVLSSTSFSLNGSVGNGAYTSGGTVTASANNQRATLNVPAVAGPGSEAICSEGVIASTVGMGVAPIAAQSQTVDATLHARPYVVNVSGVQYASGVAGSGGAKVVMGSGTLTAGSLAVTLTGDAVFTSTSTYRAVAVDNTSAAAVKVAKASGSSFTVSGTAGDVVEWVAIGF